MSDVKETVDKVIDTTADLIDTHKELAIIKFIQHSTTTASTVVVGVLGLIFLILILIFSGLGFAWWIGEKMENLKAGFFILTGAYVIILLAIMLSAKKFLLPIIRNKIIEKIYEPD
jgi:hypothetical protein